MIPSSPPKLYLARTPTPLRPLDRISEALAGPRIWLKCDDLTGSTVSGNKIRKLEFLMADALSLGCDTVITCGGLQSNHCRATAVVAAQLGLKCHLVLRGPGGLVEREERYRVDEVISSGREGNLLLDSLCGADISVFSPRYYGAQLDSIFDEISAEYRVRGQHSYAIPTGGSNGMGLWGYIEAARELQADFQTQGIVPRAVICASGSGGTQGGLTLGFHMLGLECSVLGMAVCDSAQYFDAKVREDVDQWQSAFMPDQPGLSSQLSIQTNDAYIGPGYSIGYPKLFESIRWLAKTEGVILDPVYTGKAFYGLVEEIKKGSFANVSDVVFVHTGGIFGVFPYKDEFHFD
ncbi:MAG: D-cysteine desulfhydrase family protein [Agarilytica sp.]